MFSSITNFITNTNHRGAKKLRIDSVMAAWMRFNQLWNEDKKEFQPGNREEFVLHITREDKQKIRISFTKQHAEDVLSNWAKHLVKEDTYLQYTSENELDQIERLGMCSPAQALALVKQIRALSFLKGAEHA